MSGVMTVAGRVPAAQLGVGLFGERLVARQSVPRPKRASDSAFYDEKVALPILGDLMMGRPNRDDAVLEPEHAATELTRYAQAGGGFVVDITAVDEGRDLDALRRLSARTGVHIIAASTEADDDCGVVAIPAQAGERARRAAFDAALSADGPVMLDAAGADITRLADDALERGLAPERIALHRLAASTAAVDELPALAAAGIYLLFDGLGRIPTVRTMVSDHEIGTVIARIIGAGAGDRILLGAGLNRKHAFTAFGGNGLAFVPGQFVGYLQMLGVTTAQAQRIVTTNAHEFLGGKDAA